MNRFCKLCFQLLIILFFIPTIAFAQSKKPIDHTVYDDWKDLKNETISNDGKYIAFEIDPQEGDGNLYLLKDGNEIISFPRGSRPGFSPNSNFLIFRIKPQFDTVLAKKRAKVKKDKLPKDSLGIYVFETGQILKYPKIDRFKLAEENSDWVTTLFEMPEIKEAENDTVEEENKAKKKKKKKNDNKLLVFFNPVSGDSVAVVEVSKFSFSENGQSCAFIQPRKDSIDSVTVSVFDTKSLEVKKIFEGEGFSENVSLDETGNQLAFTFSSDTAKVKAYALFYTDLDKIEPVSVLQVEDRKINENWTASKHGKIYFNEKGDELYFGIIPHPEPEIKDTLAKDEKVSVDIWNWKDPLLQTHQLKQLDDEKKRSYATVFFPGEKKTIQLGDENLKRVNIDKKAMGKYTLAFDNNPYRKLLSWESSRYRDVYLVNRNTGERELILEKVASSVSLSPAQKYIAWYNIADSSWNIYDLSTNSSRNVTASIGVNFYYELNDMPNEAGPYGMAGWTEKEKLLIYDRYDLWQIDPLKKEEAKKLTKGEGRENNTRLRYVKLDKELRYLPDNMLLSAFNEINKQAGYFGLNVKKGQLTKYIFGDYYFRKILKAKKADELIWKKESFVDFPDLYLSNTEFGKIKKLSNANPQQENYNWGTSELVEWVSFNGDSLQGILVKPEDFDPNKKYPMLVYFYERSSSRLNVYYTPKPIRSTVNWTYYASNGYLLFIPDIVYQTGYPGPSAYDCIVSGTQTLCDRYSFIDRDNLGIQGQSWGGYQTAYIITQTDMYKAAMAGAPVSNMTSAYGGIRWGSGLSRAFQYEESQSRIGATLWERRDLYILNSPLFFADQVNTPLLMMHNDEDGAVPWYQGIEFFTALRRLDRPVWLLVYNNAPHNLKRRADMKDLTIRMAQFFDFYLKDGPEPTWMKTGVPAIEKGKTTGLEVSEKGKM